MNTKLKIIIFSSVLFITACLCCPSGTSVVQSNIQDPTTTLIRINKTPTASTNIESQSGEFTPIRGRIWSGVKVYFGELKAYGFEILGFADNCDSICDECILVEFQDGNTGWKERSYLVDSGIFFVRNNDPAINAHEAWGYSCP